MQLSSYRASESAGSFGENFLITEGRFTREREPIKLCRLDPTTQVVFAITEDAECVASCTVQQNTYNLYTSHHDYCISSSFVSSTVVSSVVSSVVSTPPAKATRGRTVPWYIWLVTHTLQKTVDPTRWVRWFQKSVVRSAVDEGKGSSRMRNSHPYTFMILFAVDKYFVVISTHR